MTASTTTPRIALMMVLGGQIARMHTPPVTFVGVDGVDGAGKTHFADGLGREVARQGRPVIRVTVDGFHSPRSTRYRQGRSSPRGFFEDSYDYAAMRGLLLDPLSVSGTGRYCKIAFDLKRDAAVPAVYCTAEVDSVLIVDGIFLHREELRDYWHFSVWLESSFAVSVVRLASRDGGSPDPMDTANARYVEGQRLYMAQCQPQTHATVVVNNGELVCPFILDHAY